MPRSLPDPCLCLVTDRTLVDPPELISVLERAVAGGVDMIQLREKDLPGGELLNLARELKQALLERALVIINERVDVAWAAEADGVQLGETALPVSVARRLLGPDRWIGRSVHSVEGAIQAVDEGADFLVVGTIYHTRSHLGEEPAGPDLIRRISAVVPIPLLGIGGITSQNLGEVLEAGAQGVAVITSILSSPDPELAARRLKQPMTGGTPATQEAGGGTST